MNKPISGVQKALNLAQPLFCLGQHPIYTGQAIRIYTQFYFCSNSSAKPVIEQASPFAIRSVVRIIGLLLSGSKKGGLTRV